MKKLTIVIMIFMSIFQGVSFSEDSDKLKLVVAGDENYPPLEFVDDNGNYKGFNIDLIRAIGIELGLDIEIVPMKWDDAISALMLGKVDAIQGMNITESRKGEFDFTSKTLENSHSIFVLKENYYVKEISDLLGRKIAIQEGDVTFEKISNMEFEKIVITNDQTLAIDELINSNVDAFIGNTLIGNYYLQDTKQNDLVKIAGSKLNIKMYAIAVKKGDRETLEVLEKGVNLLYENGTYDKIYKKWFGENIDKGSYYWKNIYEISVYIIILILIVLFAIASLNWNMKKEITVNELDIKEKDRHIKQYEALSGKIVASIISGLLYFDNKGKLIIINDAAISMLQDLYREDLNVYDIEKIFGISGFEECKTKNNLFNSFTWERYDKRMYYFNYNYTLVESFGNVDGVLLSLQDFTKEHNYKKVAFESEKMKSIGTLTASIAHELRNPLTAIKIFADMMELKKGSTGFYDKLSLVLPKEVDRMDNLIVQLLDYSKPRIKNLESFSLYELVEEVLVLFKLNFREKDIKVINRFYKTFVYADRNSIKQVMINVFLNSISALDDNAMIIVSYKTIDGYVHISIVDNGSGIKKDNLKRVFEPFFTSKSDGYGIGLSVCYQLVIDNNGKIEIESELLEGTEVKIMLPMEDIYEENLSS